MATAPTHPASAAQHTETKEAPHADEKKVELKPVSVNLLIALLATDWLRGDKRHYAALLSQTRRLLKELGDDGADALAELDGLRV
jgi:hypothetical protein